MQQIVPTTDANCGACGGEWDGRLRPSPVGSFAANRFGLHGMHGNVWQWVEDCYHRHYWGAPQDGSAWVGGQDCRLRMLRDGSFCNDPLSLRSATRKWLTADYRNRGLGFRVARTLSAGAGAP